MSVLTNLIVVIISYYIEYKVMSYTVNLLNVIYQLCLKKAEKKKKTIVFTLRAGLTAQSTSWYKVQEGMCDLGAQFF